VTKVAKHPDNFVENGNDVDRQSAAGIGAARFPLQKIKSPFPGHIHDDEIIATVAFGSPLLPLTAFFFFGAWHQTAKVIGEIAVSRMLGWPARLAAASRPKDTDAG